MAALKEKIQNGLDEARMLMLACQVVVAVELRAFFEPGFERLSPALRGLKVGAIAALLAALVVLMLPGAYHRIAARGEDSGRLHRVIGRAGGAALLPFAVALAIELYVALVGTTGPRIAAAAALAFGAVALVLFFGVELLARARQRPGDEGGKDMKAEEGATSLADKIRQVLTECRVVLPGVQALLAFQFAITLSDAFPKLPPAAKGTHLVATGLNALAVVLLLTPAAWHRIVEQGEPRERFHRLASGFMLAAMVPLALALSLELDVVLVRTFGETRMAAAGALGFLVVAGGLWFGLTLASRRRNPRVHPFTARTSQA